MRSLRRVPPGREVEHCGTYTTAGVIYAKFVRFRPSYPYRAPHCCIIVDLIIPSQSRNLFLSLSVGLRSKLQTSAAAILEPEGRIEPLSGMWF